jgi:hypothetical protein
VSRFPTTTTGSSRNTIFDAASEKLSESTSAACAAEQDVIKKSLFDVFASVVLLRNSDQDK